MKIINSLSLTILSCLSLGSLQAAVTPPQVVTLGPDSDRTSVDFGGSVEILSTSQDLIGFQKFDPALGDLQEVRLTVDYSATTRVTISADSVIDSSATFDLFFDGGAEANYADIGVLYLPSDQVNIGYVIASEVLQMPAVGVLEEDPSIYEFNGSFYYEESEELDFGGPPITDSLLVTDANFHAPDFIGTGAVSRLNFSLYAEIENDGVISNIGFAYLMPEISYQTATITLEYVYTPVSTTPEGPEVTDYVRDGSVHTLHWTGTAGTTGWVIRGGTNLVQFPDDLTAEATVTEVGVGAYRAVLPLPALTAPAYFFQISEPPPP